MAERGAATQAWRIDRFDPYSSWPGLSRPSTSFKLQIKQAWMPGPSPGMTISFSILRPPPHLVGAPGTAAGGGDIEQREGEQDHGLAAVEKREKTARQVGVEIRHRRHAGNNECGRPREQPDGQQ